MAHVEPAHLVELALGNGVSSDDAGALRHIALCPRCREELTLMARVVAAARGVEESDLPVAPPPRVWRGIAREVSRAGEEAAPPAVPPAAGGSSPRPRAAGSTEDDGVVRSRRTGLPRGLRAAALLAGSAVVVGWSVRAWRAGRGGRPAAGRTGRVLRPGGRPGGR
ncbi:hypothetical protein [Streptomyces prasinopilosus]|uniref:Zinc-finger n=1 Tax=Streptomyces prasinopilosus TaxID=67344 RepID=A0A1G6LWW1_9ACTN|nr:hypothetical protein [Streptomyces prasinopilosus]SDC47206.1 hypothetical protein SAMN05216505_102274 [Streptomyces prasinopilosus]